MTSTARLLVGFFITVTIGIGGIYAYSMPYEQWLFIFALLRWTTWIVIVLAILNFFFNTEHKTVHDNKTEDELPEVDIIYLDKDTRLLHSKGRFFKVGHTNGKIWIQNCDRDGNPYSKKVMGAPNAARFGRGSQNEDIVRTLVQFLKEGKDNLPR